MKPTLPQEIGDINSSHDDAWTYQQARAYIQQFGFKTPEEFWAWRRTKERPPNFPFDPDQFYSKDWEKNEGILGFLGLKPRQVRASREEKKTWKSFLEAKAHIHTARYKSKRILTKTQFKLWAKTKTRPQDFPPNPEVVYKDQGWTDWNSFLVQWMSLGEAKAYIRKVELQGNPVKTKVQFRLWARSSERPKIFPSRPEDFYNDWIDYDDFLGPRWMSLEAAKKYIRQVQFGGQPVRTYRQFRALVKSGKLPIDLPSNPDFVYRDKGWQGYRDFLGPRWMSLEEAKAYIRQVRFRDQPLRTYKQFLTWIRLGERRVDFPFNPHQMYKDQGWIDWRDFLGRRMNLEEAKVYIRQVNYNGKPIKTHQQFAAWTRSGERPPNFPSNPERTYKDRGWVDYDDFLNTRHPVTMRGFKEEEAYTSINMFSR